MGKEEKNRKGSEVSEDEVKSVHVISCHVRSLGQRRVRVVTLLPSADLFRKQFGESLLGLHKRLDCALNKEKRREFSSNTGKFAVLS